MKYLIISLFFCIFAAYGQEYDVYSLGRNASVYSYDVYGNRDDFPRYVIREDKLFKVDSLGVKSDLPRARVEGDKIYPINKYGVESYTPIRIEIEEYLKRKYETERNKKIRK